MTHLLTGIIFSPLLGLLALLLPREKDKLIRGVAFGLSLIPLFLTIICYLQFQGTGFFEFQEKFAWVKGFNIFYHIGVDGISLFLLLLTTLLVPLVILQSWNDYSETIRGFLFFLFLLETGILGVFLALDLFLFYVFWEAVLVPMYFLIGIWGGSRKLYAAIKFVLYTMVGSLLMLAAILSLYFLGGKSFSLISLSQLVLPASTQIWLFLAFALAFAVKVPLFPFHTWLPDAHVEAPTGGSVLLAGVLLKMGTYGLIRFAFPLFPQAAFSAVGVLATLSTIGILYGSLVAMVQPDLKKLVAYTSVAHLGFVVLGIVSMTPQGVLGATLQMINHGISTGALFLLVGMIYERRHTREISAFGGLATVMPIYTVLFMMVLFSSIGLPGTNGFIGEFLILLGSFKKFPIMTAFATSGVIFGAVAMLWMAKKVFFGPVSQKENLELKDVSAREILLIIPLILLIFVIGFSPNFMLKKMEKSVENWITHVSAERVVN